MQVIHLSVEAALEIARGIVEQKVYSPLSESNLSDAEKELINEVLHAVPGTSIRNYRGKMSIIKAV